MSTYTIQRVLHQAGYHWQKNCGWHKSSQVKRKRKARKLTGIAPDTVAKNLNGNGGAASDHQIIAWPKVTTYEWNAHPTPCEPAASVERNGSERKSDERH